MNNKKLTTEDTEISQRTQREYKFFLSSFVYSVFLPLCPLWFILFLNVLTGAICGR
jgi:hypothetical protein